MGNKEYKSFSNFSGISDAYTGISKVDPQGEGIGHAGISFGQPQVPLTSQEDIVEPGPPMIASGDLANTMSAMPFANPPDMDYPAWGKPSIPGGCCLPCAEERARTQVDLRNELANMLAGGRRG